MSFLDSLLGRTKPKQAKLDALFRLPSAAVTLQAEAALDLSGQAGVCFKAGAGAGIANAQGEVRELLRLDQASSHTTIGESDDSYGYHWVVLRGGGDVEGLVGDVHVVNSTLEEHGFGPSLLCSVFGLKRADGGTPAGALVYLYKRGTFYPFVPLADEKRDNEAELRLKAVLATDLPIEPELERWFPLWGMPVA